MTVRVYRSTDAGAPVLGTTAGSLNAVLDACLVTGYGAKAGAGWTIAFTGTNDRVYRPGTGLRFYYRVTDNAVAPATGSFALLRGYESMTALTTGTNPFPTTAQATNGAFIYKWQTATPGVTWRVVATESMCYLWINTYTYLNVAISNSNGVTLTVFGDVASYKSGDAYNAYIFGQSVASGTSNTFAAANALNTTSVGNWMARAINQTTLSVQCGRFSETARTQTPIGLADTTVPNFPDPSTRGITFHPIWITETGLAGVRGFFPGMWALGNRSVYDLMDNGPTNMMSITLTNGNMSGKTLESFPFFQGRVWIETSDTW